MKLLRCSQEENNKHNWDESVVYRDSIRLCNIGSATSLPHQTRGYQLFAKANQVHFRLSGVTHTPADSGIVLVTTNAWSVYYVRSGVRRHI